MEGKNLSEMLQHRRQLCRINFMESMLTEGQKLRYNSCIYKQIRIGKTCAKIAELFAIYVIRVFV